MSIAKVGTKPLGVAQGVRVYTHIVTVSTLAGGPVAGVAGCGRTRRGPFQFLIAMWVGQNHKKGPPRRATSFRKKIK